MWGKETGRKQDNKKYPDCSFLLLANLPLDERNLKLSSKVSQVMRYSLKLSKIWVLVLFPVFWRWEFREGRSAHEIVWNDTEYPSLKVFDDFGARRFSGMIGAKARLLGGEKAGTVKSLYFLRDLTEKGMVGHLGHAENIHFYIYLLIHLLMFECPG